MHVLLLSLPVPPAAFKPPLGDRQILRELPAGTLCARTAVSYRAADESGGLTGKEKVALQALNVCFRPPSNREPRASQTDITKQTTSSRRRAENPHCAESCRKKTPPHPSPIAFFSFFFFH